MERLEHLLQKREGVTIGFHNKKNRVRCFAHIINICCSHIISSLSPKSSTSNPVDSNDASDKSDCDTDTYSSADESDGSDDDDVPKYVKPDAQKLYDDNGIPKLKTWSARIKTDPLGRARKMIRFLRGSDQRRQQFSDFIQNGNEHSWFYLRDERGINVVTKVPNLQLLRDVKTRWVSVFMMLTRLRQLKPVSCLY